MTNDFQLTHSRRRSATKDASSYELFRQLNSNYSAPSSSSSPLVVVSAMSSSLLAASSAAPTRYLFVSSLVFILLSSFSSFGAQALPLHSNSATGSKKLAPLQWSSSNRLFTDLTNSGLNYYLKINAHIGDNIDLVCPKQQLNSAQHDFMQASVAPDQAEYSVIYRVGSKYEFDNCIVNPNEPDTVQILRCDKPHANNPIMFTLYFVKFSPVPNALEFEEEREYYFLSTSSGTKEGLNYMAGGLCSKFNMRFSIKISPQQQQQQQPVPQQPMQPGSQTNYYNLKENQQQQYNAFNARNNVSLLSHIFTYNRDHDNNNNNNGANQVTDNSDALARQPASLTLDSHQMDQVKEHERYRLTTKTFSNSLEHEDDQLTTQSPQLSNLNLISSATRSTTFSLASTSLAALASALIVRAVHCLHF